MRKAGNLRITAQLIDVASQAHLWSEDYDRALQDVFAIQSDIARQVADALQITLLTNEQKQIEQQDTVDLEAHNSYLKGVYFYNQGAIASLDKSRMYFEQAIEGDPGYALAYARLADLYTRMPSSSNMPAEEAYAKARAAAEKALKLDNTLAEAHSALGSVMVRADWDWSGPSGNSRRRSHSIPVTRWPTPSMATSSYRQSGDGTTTRSLSWSGRRSSIHSRCGFHGDRLGLLSCTAMGSVSRAVLEGARVGLEVVPATHRLRQNYVQLGQYDEAIAASTRPQPWLGTSTG